MPKQHEIWMADKEQIEYLTGHCVGFPVQLYAIRWLGHGDENQYQIMLHCSYESVTSTNIEQQRANDFWLRYQESKQWYDNPLRAAAAFVRAWFQYQDSEHKGNETL